MARLAAADAAFDAWELKTSLLEAKLATAEETAKASVAAAAASEGRVRDAAGQARGSAFDASKKEWDDERLVTQAQVGQMEELYEELLAQACARLGTYRAATERVSQE